MNIAIVHELLTVRGGAERVAKVFADMFPDAPVYTLLYDEAKLGDWFPRERVRTSKLQAFPQALSTIHYPLSSKLYNHHLYLRRFPAAVEAWDFSAFDLVISSSSAFAHGIITNGQPKHLCYVHSPARYLWDRTHDVLEQAGKGLLGPVKRAYLARTFHRLRTWDAEVAPRPDRLLAASAEVQRRIELYWRRESDIVHPPIDDCWFTNPLTPVAGVRGPQLRNGSPLRGREHDSYFLVVSTLARYKRIDLAIEACNQQNVHLKIVGDGPDRARLQKLAGPSIEFCGHREGNELRDLYQDARAVLFPGAEDFGLVPVEAMACGTPLIAYRGGGALETVVEGETGAFFNEPTAESMAASIRMFDQKKYSSNTCHARAEEFQREHFEQRIRTVIAEMMH